MTSIPAGRERGASLAETALLITAVALVAAVALSFVGRSGNGKLHEAGNGIHTEAASGGGGSADSGSGSAGGGTGGPGSSGGSGGSTPTSAPTTTGPPTPTTTTQPPTTTTQPPTTTTQPPTPAVATLEDGVGTRNGSSRWDASADLQLTGDAGTSMSGTATIEVRARRSNGTWTTDTIEVPIDADGRATIETGPYSRTGSSRINTVEYTVIGVEFDGPQPWDGDQATTVITRP